MVWGTAMEPPTILTISTSVRPELVEGLFFFPNTAEAKDRVSTSSARTKEGVSGAYFVTFVTPATC